MGHTWAVGRHPLHDVAIVGVANTEQARRLEGHTSFSIAVEAVRMALDDAGLGPGDVDGTVGAMAGALEYQLRCGPAWRGMGPANAAGVVAAGLAIAAGYATTVVIADGGAAVHTDRAKTAPWTRPENEFVMPLGMFTAAEFALIARSHMHRFGTPPEALAEVAATIRNNGSINPDAVMTGRGPYTAADVLASPMIADPFHRLDCAIDSEGGAALVMTTRERAADLPGEPVYVLGGSGDRFGPAYQHPPSWDLGGRTDLVNGWIGRRAAEQTFAMAGLSPADVDVAELYDPFSFEIIRQIEAFGFCGEGEGADFVLDGHIGPTAKLPVTTDGGVLSYSHPGASAQMLQRVIRAVQQLRGSCATNQVADAEVAFVSNGGAGALFCDVLALGREAAS